MVFTTKKESAGLSSHWWWLEIPKKNSQKHIRIRCEKSNNSNKFLGQERFWWDFAPHGPHAQVRLSSGNVVPLQVPWLPECAVDRQRKLGMTRTLNHRSIISKGLWPCQRWWKMKVGRCVCVFYSMKKFEEEREGELYTYDIYIYIC